MKSKFLPATQKRDPVGDTTVCIIIPRQDIWEKGNIPLITSHIHTLITVILP